MMSTRVQPKRRCQADGGKVSKKANKGKLSLKSIIETKGYKDWFGLDNFFKFCCTKPSKLTLKMLNTMLNDGANVKKLYKGGDTALHRLIFHSVDQAESNTIKLLEFFHEHGDLNVTDIDGDTALALAVATQQHVGVIEAFMDYSPTSVKIRNNQKYNLIHVLFSTGFSLDWTSQVLKLLLDKGLNINDTDVDGNTALHLVVKYYNSTYLRTKLADYAKYEEKSVKKPVLRMLKLLIENGSDFALKNDSKQNILMLALKHLPYKLEDLDFLITRETVYCIDEDGDSPLTLALKCFSSSQDEEETVDFVDRLFGYDHCSVLASMPDINGKHPLSLAIEEKCSLEVVRLLCMNGAVPTRYDVEKCIEKIHVDALFYFLEEFEQEMLPLQLSDKYPSLILKLWYYRNKSLKLLRALIDCYKFSSAVTSEEEGTVLHKCIQFPHPTNNDEWVDYLLSIDGTDVNALITRKNAVRTKNKLAKELNITCLSDEPFSTPLVYAFSEGENRLAVKLMDHFADVNLRKLARIQVNEDLSDAIRLLCHFGYKYPMPSISLNATYFSEDYHGLKEEQFLRYALFERSKARPLFELAANAIRNYQGNKSVKELVKIRFQPKVIDALLGHNLDRSLMINDKGGLDEKLPLELQFPLDDTFVVYSKAPMSRRKGAIVRA
ncbi:putative ankyrin repeat protein L93 [Halotydeus destructor]|nr:putative ankyrin repeat protein L93 [Halotydeus destructor]